MPDDVIADPVDPTPPVPAPAPTQTKYPWRATIRTWIQAFVGIVLTLQLILPAIVDAVNGTEGVPASVRGWTAAVSGGIAVICALVARVMAIPQVEAWLQNGGAVRSSIAAKPASD
jgi:hypothetical protein